MEWLISTYDVLVGAGRAPKGRNLAWGAALCIALIVALIVSACDQSTAKKPALASPTAITQSGDGLPPFSDWRAAYLDGDGRVHAVTLDGKTDVMGPLLSGLTSPSLGFWSAGISPNGRFVAYAPPSLRVVDLTGQHTNIVHVGGLAYAMFWSFDSSQLALDEGDGMLAIFNTPNGMTNVIQNIPPKTVSTLLGWIDSTHLAVTDLQGVTLATAPNGQDQYATSIALAALDITTGHVQMIATIRSPGLGNWAFTLSPDGHKILFSNRQLRDYPYTPLVDEIDTATGAITPLSGIEQATGSGFTSVAWQPGTDRVAVSTGFIVNSDLKNWLLDLGHDQEQSLPNTGFVAGWAPESSTLVLTTGQQIENGTGPFTLTALALDANGQVASSTTLTQTAMTFPFIGFVRTV